MATGALAVTSAAVAATTEVRRGPHALHRALRKAHNGDTLRIHDGTYRESVAINKRITLRGVGGRPLIDARCHAHAPITVTSRGVTLDHLKVVGAAERFRAYPSEVDVQNVGTGAIHDMVVHDTCGGAETGAEYGINVFGSGPVAVEHNRAAGGFSDAGIYIGGISNTRNGVLRVSGNAAFLNHQGIIIENSAGGKILVAHNDVHDNKTPGVETEERPGSSSTTAAAWA